MKKRIENIRAVSIYIVFAILMIGVLLCKKNFHVDELLSYGLANNSYGLVMSAEDGIKYEPSERPFVNYLSVNAEERFNYHYVWKNQTIDVHPPLYYAVLHTICSLFPGQFSIWYAGIINIVFGLLTLMALRRLMDELFESTFVKNVISVVFVLTAEVLTMVSFLRMYVMAMFWVTLITWFFVKSVGKTWKWKDYIMLYVISVLSALTHYYCVVYLVFICAIYGIVCIVEKKWKKVGCFAGVMIGAACSAIVIFPAILEHVFSGYRGTQSIKNFANASLEDYWNRLQGFYEFFDEQLLGGMLSITLVALIIGVLVMICDKKCLQKTPLIQCKEESREIRVKWLLLWVPVILYFAVVAKMAVYIDERYVSPIFPITVVLFVGFLYGILSEICEDRIRKICLVVLSAIIIMNGWKSVEWRYLYTNSEAYIKETENYAEVDCVVIYDMLYKVPMSFLEIANYKSVTFLHTDESYLLSDLESVNNEELMIILINEGEEKLSEILEMCSNLETYEKIGGFGYGTSYYLHSLEGKN